MIDNVIKWYLFFISTIIFQIIFHNQYVAKIFNIRRILKVRIANTTIRILLANGCHKESIGVIGRRRSNFFKVVNWVCYDCNIFFLNTYFICDFWGKFHESMWSRSNEIIIFLSRLCSYGNAIRHIRLHLYRHFPYACRLLCIGYTDIWGMEKYQILPVLLCFKRILVMFEGDWEYKGVVLVMT